MQRTDFNSCGQWVLVRQLGNGGFGEVLLWRNRTSKQEVATKRLKHNPNLSADEVEKLKERWLQEYQWTRDLNSDYIVRGVVLDSEENRSFVSFMNDSHAWQPLPVIVMEYCNGGDLRTQLQIPENVNGLPEFVVRKVLRSLRNAIEFLHHKCGIYHRDLKPDNVVICEEPNGRKSYKLTDFGFARCDPEHTAKQSVVGTPHYFAPEILDTANYNINVDYWSLGVIAFEICCGVLPFIPHQTLYEILVNVRRKPYECISITEDLIDAKRFHFVENLPAEQRLSGIFSAQITKWLRLALDKDYKRRGKGELNAVDTSSKSPFIFRELDLVLQTKVLTIFCVNCRKLIHYEVNESQTSLDLKNMIAGVTGIEANKQYHLLPTGHPLKSIQLDSRPIDIYVEDWTEPVMLYVVGYQCDYNALEQAPVSENVRQYLQFNWTTLKRPAWQKQQFVRHTHYLLAHEQGHLTMFLDGLKVYAMEVEHIAIEYDEKLQILEKDAMIVECRLNEFASMINCGKQAIEQKFANGATFYNTWLYKSKQLIEAYNVVKQIIINIRKHYQSALRNMKQEATSSIYDELKERDIYRLTQFRKDMVNFANSHQDADRQSSCISFVYACLNEREELHKNINVSKTSEAVSKMHKFFMKICDIVRNAFVELNAIRKKHSEAIFEYHEQLIDAWSHSASMSASIGQLTKSVNVLNVDGDDGMTASNFDSSPFNSILGLCTNELINDAIQNMNLMSIDYDDNIPSTVHQMNGMP